MKRQGRDLGFRHGLICGFTVSVVMTRTLFGAAPSNMDQFAVPFSLTHELDETQRGELIRWGFQRLADRHLDEAVHAFERVLMADPMNRSARFGISTVFAEMGHAFQAAALLEKLLLDFPNDYPVLNNFAWLLATTPEQRVRNPPRALDLAKSAMMLAPDDYHVWSTLSEAYFAIGNFEPAYRAAQKAHELYRASSSQDNRLQIYVQRVERCKKAVQTFSLIE